MQRATPKCIPPANVPLCVYVCMCVSVCEHVYETCVVKQLIESRIPTHNKQILLV